MSAADAVEPLSDATLPEYLRDAGLAGSSEELSVEPAGDGNINWVRRVRATKTGHRWIVKQARPALERFPQYRASTERIVFEHRWLAIARPLDRDGVCPEVLAFDEARRVLVLEDLGAAERLDAALARGAGVTEAVSTLARLLAAVHAHTASDHASLARRFANQDMQRLHGDHVFHLPFRENDFPLPVAVRAAAERVWRDSELVAIADRAYARYLEPRGALVHGDVQAANVLLAPSGPKLLDAEIAHVGDPALDVGMLIAHLLLAAVGRSRAIEAMPAARASWGAYRRAFEEARAPAALPPFGDAVRIAGIEVMRRTIGAARVAAVENPAASLAAVDLATRLMRTPPESPSDLESALGAADG